MPHATGQVALAGEHSALTILHTLLAEAIASFPDAFREADFPQSIGAFRKSYADVLPRLEAARLASAERASIARHIVDASASHILWQDSGGAKPLCDALREPADALALNEHQFAGAGGWQPSFTYRGTRYEAGQLARLGELLVERGVITARAGEALTWLVDKAFDDGALRLSGRKVVMLGAGAEMAPTRFWLEAGADVLWLDTRPPPAEWSEAQGLAGRLFWPGENADLLSQPREILATLVKFANGSPLDLGLYAYAPGQAREMRLTAAMNAIVDALPADLVASVTMLVSPTTPTELTSEDLEAIAARRAGRPFWEAACDALGLVGRGGGFVSSGDASATRTVVTIQGGSYQAAQYLGKILVAERWARFGQAGSDGAQPLRVSANTAAITRTRSLDHPVFAAAFGGAEAMRVETMTPRQSRRLNGLLAVRDWLHPDLPVPGDIRVHGGIHTLPYPLGSALRVAAAIGFARSPRLLRGFISR